MVFILKHNTSAQALVGCGWALETVAEGARMTYDVYERKSGYRKVYQMDGCI